MEKIETRVRKWGNSIGIIIPKEIVDKKNINENDILIVTIVKEIDLSSVFGSIKRKRSGQNFKNEVRKGWEK